MRHFIMIVRIILFCSILFGISSAQSPFLVNYQGYLTDANGKALTGDQQITFMLYEKSTGGEPVWQEVQTVIVENGLFNVLLGGADSTLSIEHFAGERFLGIKIGNEDEMEPRMRLASVTHSLLATQAESAYTLDSPDNGPADAVYVDNSGKVGIGKNDPQAELDVNGNIIADNNMVKIFEGTVDNKSSYDIVNLNGNAHKIYKIYFHGTLHTAETYLLVEANGEGVADKYRSWERYDGDAGGGWNFVTWGLLMGRSWLGECDLNAEFVMFCEAGRGRFGQGKGMMWYKGDHRSLMLDSWGRWGDTTANITSLRISVKNAAGVATGTFSGRFIIYALNAR